MNFSPLAPPEIVEMKCHSDEICVMLVAIQEGIEIVNLNTRGEYYSINIMLNEAWLHNSFNMIHSPFEFYILRRVHMSMNYIVCSMIENTVITTELKKMETRVLIFLEKTYNNFHGTRDVIPMGPIVKKSVLDQVMDWPLPGDKTLHEPILTKCLTPYGLTRLQWVK